MDYKEELHKMLNTLSEDGYEGAIPILIAEVMASHQFKHNESSEMVRNTIYHLQHKL